MNEEKRRILTMVQEGRISAEEGARLLEALDGPGHQASGGSRTERVVQREVSDRSGRSLHVRVTRHAAGKDEVEAEFSIPLGFARMAANFIPQVDLERLDIPGLNLDEIIEAVQAGEAGQVFRMDDAASGRLVEAWIE